MTEDQKLQWEKRGVPGVEELIEKGYQHCVQFFENEKAFGEPLCFKDSKNISLFMQLYPNMKIKWHKDLSKPLI